MLIARFILKVITSGWAILLVNFYLFVLIAYDLCTALSGTTRAELIELRGEDLADLVVTWAVLLESRELLLTGGRATLQPVSPGQGLLNSEAARSGLLLLSLGILLQIVTYFDFDVQAKMLSVNLSATFNVIEWLLMALLGVELLASCWSVVRSYAERNSLPNVQA